MNFAAAWLDWANVIGSQESWIRRESRINDETFEHLDRPIGHEEQEAGIVL